MQLNLINSKIKFILVWLKPKPELNFKFILVECRDVMCVICISLFYAYLINNYGLCVENDNIYLEDFNCDRGSKSIKKRQLQKSNSIQCKEYSLFVRILPIFINAMGNE